MFDTITTFFAELESMLLTISGSMAVIGVIGLGIMYLGSSLPLISDWKQSNPKAFTQVMWGLIFISVAGSGAVGAIIAI